MRDKNDRSILAWWTILGLGLGLIVLSALLWVSQGSPDARHRALERDLERLAPVVENLSAGREPDARMLEEVSDSALAPLLQALIDASRQRRQALLTYQTQIEAVGLGEGLQPSTLVVPAGRHSVRQKLTQLNTALDDLARQDQLIQSRLDEALGQWLQQVPGWDDEERRKTLLATSADTTQTMTAFFEVERGIVRQVEALLTHLDKVGKGVALENGAQQELVFSKAADLNYYRAALLALGDLGRREQQLLAQAQQSAGQHARLVGHWLTASSVHASR
ncbi:MAG: hypothetical protein WAQ08_11125 [Aquabacterium sp.]|jgi:hypothetical protein|uniref:hypothetical protein n=1 Tax=Aquabacterium sp. TaxID=1872578 RepID=UPI003BB0000E